MFALFATCFERVVCRQFKGEGSAKVLKRVKTVNESITELEHM
jgi:hypothetical protein